MTEFENFIKILESSVERNGEKNLTNKWLLNIAKMSLRNYRRLDVSEEASWEDTC